MNDSPTVLVHAKGLRKDYGSGEGLVQPPIVQQSHSDGSTVENDA